MPILKQILFLLIVSTSIFCQTEKKENWKSTTTEIAIDSRYILNEPILYNGISFNYWRTYIERKIAEFGNVDSLNKPNGHWLYLNNLGAIILQGETANGYKTGIWNTKTKAEYIYEWDCANSETVLKKKSDTTLKKERLNRKKRSLLWRSNFLWS